MGVGNFFISQMPTMRSPENPLDKCTIVSIYPKELNEKKDTIFPGRFKLEPGTYDNPAVLVVGPSSWYRFIDENQPLIEIPNGSIVVADSVVNDYCRGLYACDMTERKPGLFYVPGAHTAKQIKEDFKDELERARIKQINFYREIVRLADIFWARTNGNPIAISDDAKMAAAELQLDKPWMNDQKAYIQENCPMCGTLRNPAFPMCSNCKAILDPAKAKELGLNFAVV